MHVKALRRRRSRCRPADGAGRWRVAQFGHPLKGQWSGEWGPKDNPNRLLLDLALGRQGDHRPHQSGPDAGDGQEGDHRLLQRAGVEGPDRRPKARTPRASPCRSRSTATLENIGAYYRVLPRHVDAGRTEGRLHGHAELITRLLDRRAACPSVAGTRVFHETAVSGGRGTPKAAEQRGSETAKHGRRSLAARTLGRPLSNKRPTSAST